MDQVSDIVTLEMINTVIPTYIKYISVSCPPAEKGQFLALDLGGSKFKVLQVKVREGMGIRRGGVEMEEKTYPIPEELLTGRGAEVRRRESRAAPLHGGVGQFSPSPSFGLTFCFHPVAV